MLVIVGVTMLVIVGVTMLVIAGLDPAIFPISGRNRRLDRASSGSAFG